MYKYRKKVRVYTRNGICYLEGWALFELAPGLVKGSKDQYYEIDSTKLNDLLHFNSIRGTSLSAEYVFLPENANIYKAPAINKYLEGEYGEILKRIIQLGFDNLIVAYNSSHTTPEKIEGHIRNIWSDTIVSLAKDYINNGIDEQSAITKAVKELNCTDPEIIISISLKLASEQQKKEPYIPSSNPFFRR